MKKLEKDQSIQNTINQLIRFYRVPMNSSKEDALNTILSKIDRNEKSKYAERGKTSVIRITRVAVAAVAALVLIVYLFTATTNYSNIDGATVSIRLPDKSRVVLANNSQLSLKKYFWNRNVSLDGTAYFEVEKGSTFKVITSAGNVEVLGTRFLVEEENNAISVKCFEGKVKTIVGDNNYILNEGNKVENATNELKSEIISFEDNFPEVAIFKGDFRSAPLHEIINELNSFFGVEIDAKINTDQRFTGTIETGSINSALEIVCASLQLEYKFIDTYTIQIYK